MQTHKAAKIFSIIFGDSKQQKLNQNVEVRWVAISELITSTNQLRTEYDMEALEALANSIKTHGILSPIVVKKISNGENKDKYEIIAGMRRFKAAQIAGYKTVPIIEINVFEENVKYELALIENLQRQNLNVVEEARAYKHLTEQNYTQEAIAAIVGKSRSHVANLLRLLTLPESTLELLKVGKIDMSHAKILIGHKDAEEIANKAATENLSVKHVEELLKPNLPTYTKAMSGEKESLKQETEWTRYPRDYKESNKKDDLSDLAKLLSDGLKTKVKLKALSSTSGNIIISYNSLEQLDDITLHLSKNSL